VKRPKGKKPTKEQENFLRIIRENGGIAGRARSREEAIGLIMVRRDTDRTHEVVLMGRPEVGAT